MSFLDVILIVLPLPCGLVLGTLRFRPGTVSMVFLLTPLLLALAALLYQATHPVITHESLEGPVTVNLTGYVVNSATLGLAGISALTAWLGAWAGNYLTGKVLLRRI